MQPVSDDDVRKKTSWKATFWAGVVVVVVMPARAVASLHHGPVGWPVCLQRLAGTDPVSLWSWSVQRARGRPGRRLQSLPSERLDARPTWQCRALCAGVPWVSRAMWPNTDKRRFLMKSITGGKPVRADMSAFVTCWDQCMGKIWRRKVYSADWDEWHLNADQRTPWSVH